MWNWDQVERPIVALSPMADMTDSSFCRIVKSKANPIVFREMVSAEAVVRGNDKTLDMTEVHEAERPLVQQIFGSDPDTMAEAARIICAEHKPEGIDINMGCPVYKITSNFNGCALMKDPERASEIIRKMKAAIGDVPLSVKIRAGWSDYNECIEFAKIIEAAGAQLITVHGRTKVQGYAGKARRDIVAEVKKVVSIPVLYNGDVFTAQDYFDALEQTGCDGVLIARGALGNPWIFEQIERRKAGLKERVITPDERVDVVLEHLKLHLEQYGEGAVTTFRKHLSWYFKGIEHFKETKMVIMQTKSAEEIERELRAWAQRANTHTQTHDPLDTSSVAHA